MIRRSHLVVFAALSLTACSASPDAAETTRDTRQALPAGGSGGGSPPPTWCDPTANCCVVGTGMMDPSIDCEAALLGAGCDWQWTAIGHAGSLYNWNFAVECPAGPATMAAVLVPDCVARKAHYNVVSPCMPPPALGDVIVSYDPNCPNASCKSIKL